MRFFIYLIVYINYQSLCSGKIVNSELSVPQLIQQNGYPCETHIVKTDDNYFITIHRIPHSKKLNQIWALQPVILQHSFLGSSADFILRGPKRSLAFILSDAGYDVWLPNSRGNRYSRRHTVLSDNDKEYWNFSWDEMAHYDFPATIDRVTNVTKQFGNIIVIGHSMGCTIALASLSEKIEYNFKIKALFAYAPVTGLKHFKSLLRYFSVFSKYFEWFLNFLGMNELGPDNILLNSLSEMRLSRIYVNNLFSISNEEDMQLEKILKYVPAGTSLNTLIHYAQEINANGRFQHYDFGPQQNLIKYGVIDPPAYNISSITVPICIFYGTYDNIAVKEDVVELYEQIINPIKLIEVPFTHIDFIWGKKSPELVYTHTLKLIKMLN